MSHIECSAPDVSIGGLMYRNCEMPIMLADEPLLKFYRNSDGNYGVHVKIRNIEGQVIAEIFPTGNVSLRDKHLQIENRDEGQIKIKDKRNGWIIYRQLIGYRFNTVLDISFTTYQDGLPIFFHPNRTILFSSAPVVEWMTLRGMTLEGHGKGALLGFGIGTGIRLLNLNLADTKVGLEIIAKGQHGFFNRNPPNAAT